MRLAQKGSIDVVQYVTFGSQNHKSNNDPNKLRMIVCLAEFPSKIFFQRESQGVSMSEGKKNQASV